MINRSILVGRLTKEPSIEYTQSNIAFCKFNLAVNRTYTEADGERKADFIQCVVWRKTAENMKYVHKGSLIGVEGRIQTGRYENDKGITIYTTDVICDSVQFLEPKGSNEPKQNTTPHVEPVVQRESIDVSEDDLPF